MREVAWVRVRVWQPSNALAPTRVTVLGIVSAERLLQPLNAWASMLDNFFESAREVSPLQPAEEEEDV